MCDASGSGRLATTLSPVVIGPEVLLRPAGPRRFFSMSSCHSSLQELLCRFRAGGDRRDATATESSPSQSLASEARSQQSGLRLERHPAQLPPRQAPAVPTSSVYRGRQSTNVSISRRVCCRDATHPQQGGHNHTVGRVRSIRQRSLADPCRNRPRCRAGTVVAFGRPPNMRRRTASRSSCKGVRMRKSISLVVGLRVDCVPWVVSFVPTSSSIAFSGRGARRLAESLLAIGSESVKNFVDPGAVRGTHLALNRLEQNSNRRQSNSSSLTVLAEGVDQKFQEHRGRRINVDSIEESRVRPERPD